MFDILKKAFDIPHPTKPLDEILAEASHSAVIARPLSSCQVRLFKYSMHIRHVDAGSCNACDWEMTHLLSPVYDLQRFGFDFVASPRHADLLMVTGPVSAHLREALLSTYRCMPEPRLVMALGDCACGRASVSAGYAVCSGVESVLPVDIFIRGCPPKPVDIIEGLLRFVERVDSIRG